MSTDETNLLSKGLKFVPTPTLAENRVRRQLLKYIYHGQNNKLHPFYVKSNWEPPVQLSIALET